MIENIEFEMPINENGELDWEAQESMVEKYQCITELKSKIEGYKKQVQELNVEIESDLSNVVRKKIGELFNLSVKTNNSSFTKAFIDKHQGNIPVYSASKLPDSVDYGYVEDNLLNIKYFENCLTWNIDGSIGKAHYRQGRFSLSEKVIPLVLHENLKNNLNLEFLKYAVEAEFSLHSFGFDNKAGKGKIQNIEIPLPIKPNGEFDLEAQKAIAEKYKRIEQVKKSLAEELDKMLKMEVDYE